MSMDSLSQFAETIIKYKGNLGTIVLDSNYNARFLPVNYNGDWNELEFIEIINRVAEATLDEKIEYIKISFKFGKILEIFVIGDYAIVKARMKNNDIKYFPYLNFKYIGDYYDDLDLALIGAIAYKYEGVNSQAGEYFCKMIGV